MGLIWLGLAAVAVWALARLGRQTERARRGHWRISATILSSALFAGAVLAASRGVWLAAISLAGGGLWLAVQSRVRSAAPRAPVAERLSEAEARAILGVSADATQQDIQAAWRRLMARAHPDQGGTEGLAARVNAARDRLLKE
ncbi:DnaJ domain-containing protein [Brevundimonas pondensis]|uniref:Molecular chaperone DnaJ n=1 Tax=Brevundimonas pondensis TaxID=2774189 RepID=A0ABX7SRY2_9CAUL|nr:DnaJ domain-containing protein [Brevundimonas pondensis]QTC89116.1 molecular chaperone DnaJ [Brevundimonas pondensis]